MYRNGSENIKREVILCANIFKKSDWLRELKEEYPRLDNWSQRALLIACKNFPQDEKKFYLQGIKTKLNSDAILEKIIINWAIKS